jgi:ferredoxin, 2Fe-2S
MRVRVEPSGVEVEVGEGQTLMRAAEQAGYRWPTVCHGQAVCTACHIVVDEPAAFEPPHPLEVAGLELLAGQSFYEGKHVRLACQVRPVKDTVVTKRGVRKIS